MNLGFFSELLEKLEDHHQLDFYSFAQKEDSCAFDAT